MVRRIFSLLLAICLLIGLVPPVAQGETAETPDGMVSSQALIDKMKAREGFSATPYWDYSHYSIGYGTTCPSSKVDYYKKNPMSKEEAEAEFKKHLAEFEADVNDFATKHSLTLKQHQFDALVSFSYNCGSSWMSSTSGYFNTAVRQGDTGAALLYGMALYSTAGGQYILIGRRLWEANMYINGDYGEGEKGSYPDNYRWVFLDGNGGTVRYKICAFDTKHKAQLPEAFDDIPIGTGKDGKTFVYDFAGWYTAQGKKVTKLDSNLSAGQELYARWTDPEGNFREDETLPAFPIKATANAGANLRKGPGTNYGKNGKLEVGQAVKVLEEAYGTEVSGNTTWCRIGTDKWVTKAYLDYNYPGQEDGTPEFPKTGKVVNVTASVNVRKGPGTGYEQNGKLAKDAKVTVTEEKTGTSHTIAGVTTDIWCKVGEDQWVCKGYISYIGADDKPVDNGGTKLKSLKLVKAPTQQDFIQPIVEPDWEGSVLLATYQNGYQQAFTATRSMVSDFDGSQLGEQTVTVSYAGKSVSFAVNVGEIKAVSKLSGVLTENNSVTLSWKKAANATHYYVYYRKAGAKSYKRAGTTTATSYTVPNLEINAEYQFCVYSYNIFEGYRRKGPASKVISLFMNDKMTAPVSLKATWSNETTTTLSWKAAKGATHYDVMYKAQNAGDYTLAGRTDKLTFTVTGLKVNTQYDYKVISYLYENKTWEEGPQTQPVSLFQHPAIGAPANLTVKQTAHQTAKLSWTKGQNVSLYQVQYKLSGDKAYTTALTTDKPSCTLTLPNSNGTYQFRVVSYYKYGANTVEGPQATAKLKVVPKPDAPQGMKAVQTNNGEVALSWNASASATHYNVYYRLAGASAYTKAGSTKETSYTIAGLVPNGTYTFRVISYYKDATGSYKGLNTQVSQKLTIQVAAPTGLKVTLVGHDDVKLTWKAAKGANRYYVHYRKAGAKSYTRATITSDTSYTIQNLADNTAYEFRVYSYYDGHKGKPSGAAPLSTTRNLSAPKKVTVQLYGYDDAKITWSKVKYATAYRVYYKRSGQASYKYIGQYTGTSAKKANLYDGYQYTFKVVPVISVNGGYYKDDSSKSASVTTLKKVPRPKVTKYSSSKVKVSWTDISGESGYQIGVYSDKACTKKVTITTATGKNKTLSVKRGKTYYYKVRAYKTVGSKKYYAPWSSIASFTLQ